MKKLIPAFALLLISAVVLSTASFAWFSMNRTVTATGMSIQAKSTSSLVIGDSYPVGTSVKSTKTVALPAMIPATYDASASYSTHLKYVTNTADVDASKGSASQGKTLSYADAINAYDVSTAPSGNLFYFDYVVYIASSGGELTNQALTVSIESATALSNDAADDTLKAASIDFYVNEDSTDLGNYKGTLNLAGLDRATNNGSATKTSVELVPSTGTIPQNGSNSDYLQVTMRVYFDGALLKSAGQHFIYSDVVNINTVNINATFTAPNA